MSKKILVIFGHSFSDTFGEAMMNAYRDSAQQAGAEVKVLILKDMEFDPILRSIDQILEPDLITAREAILWSEHITFIYPTWWANVPALLKGFLDRTFLTGFAYAYKKNSPFPEKLLKGRTSRLLITMDAPGYWNQWISKEPQNHSVRINTLMFSGIKPVRVNNFCEIRTSTPEIRKKWLKQVRGLAIRDMG